MPAIGHLTVPSTYPLKFTVTGTQRLLNAGGGATFYYSADPNVSSGDTSVAAGAEALLAEGVYYLISGARSEVWVFGTDEDQTFDDIIADTITLTGGITAAGGETPASPRMNVPNLSPAAVTFGTNTTPADGTQFVTPIYLPENKTLTGVGWLIGDVGGTDRTYAVLYDSAGAVLRNSTLTTNGTVAGTTATYQQLAFTSTYAAKGPARYYVGISIKGTTARIRTAPAVIGAQLGVAGTVEQVHATVAAIEPPATFTADTAPIVYLY